VSLFCRLKNNIAVKNLKIHEKTNLNCFLPFLIRAQVTPFANDFKSIYIGDNGVGDYTRDLILVHEIYNGTAIG